MSKTRPRAALPPLLLAGGAAIALLFASCAKAEEPSLPGRSISAADSAPAAQASAASAPSAAPAAADQAPALPVALAEKPWYAERFESLGFYVFPEPVDIGDFSVEALKGASARLSAARGKIVLLNFWATWCPPCRLEMPSIEALWAKTKAKPFTVMAVSVGEERATVEKFIAQEKYSYPIYLDPSGQLGAAFNARSIPTTYVVDKGGRVIAGMVGSRMYDGPEVLALFAELAER